MPGLDGWSVLQRAQGRPCPRRHPGRDAHDPRGEEPGLCPGRRRLHGQADRPRAAAHAVEPIPRGGDGAGAPWWSRTIPIPAPGLCRRLREEGWTVAEAENGRVALARLAEAPADLVLLDLIMPEMDGFEFLDELRRTEAGRGLPVIVVTAADLSDERPPAAQRRRAAGPAEGVPEPRRASVRACTSSSRPTGPRRAA